METGFAKKKDEWRVVNGLLPCKATPRVSASEIIQRKANIYNPRVWPRMGDPSYYGERVTLYIWIILRKDLL